MPRLPQYKQKIKEIAEGNKQAEALLYKHYYQRCNGKFGHVSSLLFQDDCKILISFGLKGDNLVTFMESQPEGVSIAGVVYSLSHPKLTPELLKEEFEKVGMKPPQDKLGLLR